MRIGSTIGRGWVRLGRSDVELSVAARRRLKWLDYYRACGSNSRLTCRHFDSSAQTFYHWRRRYSPHDLTTLESRSRRPRRLRRPTWDAALEQAVLKLRRQYPRWGKDKLAVLLRAEGCAVSVSMVGRILTWLKRRGAVGRTGSPRHLGAPVPIQNLNPDVLMMEPAEDWYRCYSADLHRARSTALRHRSRAAASRRRPLRMPQATTEVRLQFLTLAA